MPITLKQRQEITKDPHFLDLVKWGAARAASDIIDGEGSASLSYIQRTQKAIAYINNPDTSASRLVPIILGLASDVTTIKTLAGIEAIVKAIWIGIADFEQANP